MSRNSYRKRSPEIEAFPIKYHEIKIGVSEDACGTGFSLTGYRGDYLVIEDGELSIIRKDEFEASYEKKPHLEAVQGVALKAYSPPRQPVYNYYLPQPDRYPPRRRHRSRKAKFNNSDGSSAYKKDE
jgi:hypothetical protein